jgi:glycosyltransferase involved in cell wall biosynthesis/2-polyprenyl-3-methyl-5-hydroxy-6-metoxy-1,4-benzoquinol methylase
MNVLFVNYHDFTSNSAIHIFNLANRLAEQGVACVVCVPTGKDTVAVLGDARFRSLDFAEALEGRVAFADGQGPTLVHAWTPRESVRALTERLVERHGCPYVVHLEDNEDLLTARQLQIPLSELHASPVERFDKLVGAGLSHPGRCREFLAGAAGVTVIIDRLMEFKPPGVPGEVIWPAFDEHLFKPQPADPALRRRLGLGEADRVVVYAGNVHAVNLAEVASLYLAIGAINRAGLAVKLVRVGRDFADPLEGPLAALRQHVIDVGYRPHVEIPRYLALADALVQPGRADPFNDYRFPAKLPEFLAMGLPVVLPDTNIGRHLEDGEECLLLREGSALEIAASLERLFKDPDLRSRLGRAARAFAEKNLSWQGSAAKLHHFYEQIMGRLTSLGDRPTLEHVARRYAAFAPARLGYASVEDYSDSVDHLPALARLNDDLKDVQRPWVLKAILGRVARGARLLEIGGGDPWVADLLARLGYEVWIVDPYDGRDGGPADFEALRSRHAHIRFVRGLFPQALSEAVEPRFDCVYSISVLEHIPDGAIPSVVEGIVRHTRGRFTIHAVDHVLKGAASAAHLAKLTAIVTGLGVPREELDRLLDRLADDPDAYFLSAEAHNRWRGERPYRDFPMRRVVSIHLCAEVPRS